MKTTVIQILWSIDMYPTEIQIALEENETIMEMLKNHLLMVGMKSPTRDMTRFTAQDMTIDFNYPYGKIIKIERNESGYFATVEYNENRFGWEQFFESGHFVIHPLVMYDTQRKAPQKFQIICFHLYSKTSLAPGRVYDGVKYKDCFRDTRDNNIGVTVYD